MSMIVIKKRKSKTFSIKESYVMIIFVQSSKLFVPVSQESHLPFMLKNAHLPLIGIHEDIACFERECYVTNSISEKLFILHMAISSKWMPFEGLNA